MREDHYAAWAWLILILGIIGYVAAFDIWAKISGHMMMTTQFKTWLFDAVIGPFIVFGWIGSWAGLTWHFFTRRPR